MIINRTEKIRKESTDLVEQNLLAENGERAISVEEERQREQKFEDAYLQEKDPEFFKECERVTEKIRKLENVRGLFIDLKEEPGRDSNDAMPPIKVKEEDVTAQIMAARIKEYKELKNRRVQLEKEGEDAKNLTNSFFGPKPKPIHETIQAVAPQLLMGYEETRKYALDFGQFKSRYNAERDAYERKVAGSLGLKSLEEMRLRGNEIRKGVKEKRLQGFGLGTILNRGEIKRMKEEENRLQNARENIRQADIEDFHWYGEGYYRFFPLNSCRDKIVYAVEDEVKSLVPAVTPILDKVAPKIGEEQKPADYLISIPREVKEAVIKRCLELDTFGMWGEGDEKKKQEKFDKILNVVLAMVDKEEKGLEPRVKFLKLPPVGFNQGDMGQATKIFEEFKSFQEAASRFSKLVPNLPELKKTESLLREVKKTSSSFGHNIYPYEFDRIGWDIENPPRIIAKEAGWWENFRPICEEKYGKEFAAYADIQAGRAVQDVVLTYNDTSDNRDKRESFGRMLFQFPQQEFVPVAILNAYREPGYSGQRPLVRNRDSYENKLYESPVEKYIKSLPAETIKSLQENNPSIAGIIKEIITNPEAALNRTVKDGDGDFTHSPVYKKIIGAINDYSLNQLESDRDLDKRALFFVECFNVDKSTPEATDRMLALYDNLPGKAKTYLIENWSSRSIAELNVKQQAEFIGKARGTDTKKDNGDMVESIVDRNRGYGPSFDKKDAAEILINAISSFDSSLRPEIVKMAIKSRNLHIIDILQNKIEILKEVNLDTSSRRLLVEKFINHAGQSFVTNHEFEKIRDAFPTDYSLIIEDNKNFILDKNLSVKERNKAAELLASVARYDKDLENYYKDILKLGAGKEAGVALTQEQKAAIFIFQRFNSVEF